MTESTSPSPSKFLSHSLLQPEKVIKRAYQVNIFATCAKSNCLVVIPTGLGKTIVALLLAIHQLKQPGSRFLFLAPTRPLVEQHLRTFRELTILEENQLRMMTGSIGPEKRAVIYADPEVRGIFLTPQVLQNDVIGGKTTFKGVTLVIFDEAHRAVGNYAYTFLAKKYFSFIGDSKQSNKKILALTASPGKNRDKIKEVMQNLHLDMVEIRTESDPDVKPYVQDVETEWVDVELPEEMKDVLAILEKLLKKLVEQLHQNDLLDTVDMRKISRKSFLEARTLLDRMIVQNHSSEKLPLLFYCKKLLSNAIRISHMQELIEAQGVNALHEYIQKNSDKVAEGKGGTSLRELFNSSAMENVIEKTDLLIQGNVDHPKVALLLTLLTEQFSANSGSRVLVFCHFRDTVNFLVDEANKLSLIKASRFVGQQGRGKQKGLSQKEQLRILQDFKEGTFNTLMATSVAEEGLDISECDMVVFFDVVPSEIRAIQRRGRTGRNSAGKVVIFKTVGTREEGYYWAERHRERQMKSVLQDLRREMKHMEKNQREAKSSMESSNNLLKYIKKSVEDKKTPEIINESPQSPEASGSVETSDPLETSENSQKLDKTTKKTKDNVIPSGEEIDFTKFDDKIGSSSPFILIDSRETASPLTRMLSEMNTRIELRTLPIGDYIVSTRCGIERKSISDFTSSLKDGRLFNELIRLRKQFSRPILILEGDYHSIISINRSAILGTLTSIVLKMEIFLIQTRDAQDTAEMIFALAKKEQKAQSRPFSIRFKKIPEQLDKQLEHIVAGIPGINIARAQDLLREFRTLRTLFNTPSEELQRVHNIGRVIADKIVKYSNLDYYLKDEESTNNE
ncbi:MAG: ERCC4 domain-containing protein [Promethearchaeota archaeon]